MDTLVCIYVLPMCMYVYIYVYLGTVAQVLALPPHSKKVMGSIPAWGAVGSGGQVLPRPGLSPGPFCVEFACSPRVHKGFPPIRTPTEKNMQNNSSVSCPSVTEAD